MVSSHVYPGLERKPGGPDNWVERAGGLPTYIERIAKHLHYERGFTISRAIASAVNTVKRWAHMGKVAKYGDPNQKRVSAKTAALAAKAVAEWEAKKKAGKINLSDVEEFIIDMTELSDEFVLDLAEETEHLDDSPEQEAGAEVTAHAILSAMDVKSMAQRANQIADPEKRATARQRVLDFAGVDAAEIIDLASTIAPRNARGRAKDGRRSYKGQGKWKHGFVPVNQAAKESKAKGSPIAVKRLNRLFGANSKPDDERKATREVTGRAGSRSAGGRKASADKVFIDEKNQPGSERADRLGSLVHTKFNTRDQKTSDALPKEQMEASKASRIPARAKQNWDEIPDHLKTVRNGKRYVMAEFGGKGFVTEWVGGVRDGSQKSNKVRTSLTTADAAKLSSAERTQILNDPRTPPAVKAAVRRAEKRASR